MELSKCKNCGANDYIRKGDKYVCQYCGTEYPIPAEELGKEKKAKKASKNTAPRHQSTPISHDTQKTGYVDASPKKPPKKKLSQNSQIAITVIIVIVILAIFSSLSNTDSNDENEAEDKTAAVETETVKATEATKTAEAAKTEIKTESSNQTKEKEAVDIFDYDISGNEVKLKSYLGHGDFLEITPTYTVNGKEYNTNLSTFEIGSHNIDTIIFDEGITELYLLTFNDTCAKQVYLPSTLTYIYDKTLSYLREDSDGGVVQIYYGGTEDQWNSIYTEYDRSQVNQEDAAADLGASLANTINSIVEDGSGEAELEYHFYALPSDLK